MGNRRRMERGGTGTKQRSAVTVSATSAELPAARPPGQHGTGNSLSPWCSVDLDAYIQDLADAVPPLTGEQRDILALLLRRPRRR